MSVLGVQVSSADRLFKTSQTLAKCQLELKNKHTSAASEEQHGVHMEEHQVSVWSELTLPMGTGHTVGAAWCRSPHGAS